MTATDGDKDRPENIVYFLTGQGIDTDRPDQSKFDINKTTGEIFVLKVGRIMFLFLLYSVHTGAYFIKQYPIKLYHIGYFHTAGWSHSDSKIKWKVSIVII